MSPEIAQRIVANGGRLQFQKFQKMGRMDQAKKSTCIQTQKTKKTYPSPHTTVHDCRRGLWIGTRRPWRNNKWRC